MPTEKKSRMVNAQEMASKCLCVSRAAFGERLSSLDVIFALTFSLKPVSHGLNVILLLTQFKASFAHFLYLAENMLRIPRITRATRQILIVSFLFLFFYLLRLDLKVMVM
jgi:hypothetical protein